MPLQLLRRFTVARKLTWIIMATTAASLLLACFCAATYDVLTVRERMVQDLSILAELMGSNSTASLEFRDPDVAKEVLGSLKVHPNVISATTFDAEGKQFARYVREGEPESTGKLTAQKDGHRFEDDRLVLYRSIKQGESEPIGSVMIVSDLNQISERMWSFLGIVVVIMLGAMTLAFIMSSRLQRVISQPLLALAGTASTVSKTRDYSIRAEKTDREDEIGMLTESFNEMLEQIEERDEAIRKANEDLAKSERKALEATEAKSSFLANMSHELRTPLNSIIGFSEVLLDEVEGDDAKADLEMIHAAGKHLLTLINGILDLSKIEAGKMELYIEPYEMPKLIQEVQRTIDPLVQQRGNVLKVTTSDPIGTVKLDVTKLRQCLLNLLSNANKFTEEGTVSLDVRRTNSDGREWIQLEVSDTGIGMTPEQLQKLFQPFTQADSSTSRRYGGTGLGLTISKRFCEMMGGTIRVESTSGEGTTFTIEIPYDSAVESEREDSSLLASDSKKTVLVIDDSEQVHKLMGRFLSDEGWTVVTASNGPDGVRMAKQIKPAVITLDVMMDGMDGWAVLSKLKGDPQTADVPVVMLSIIDDKRMGYALGASDYITKPIDRNTLSRVLGKYRTGQSDPVLVVDDDSSTRGIIHRMLDQEGWQVIEASNGKEAVRRMQEQLPRLVLLDLIMPEMNGFEFIDQMKEHEDWRDVPVIIVSGHEISTAERQQLNGCVKAVIHKNAQGFDSLLQQILKIVNTSAKRPVLSMETASGKRPSKPAPARHKRSLRVLLADDNSFNQRLAVRVLKSLGHVVTLADNGREAVQRWEEGEFDLILMDVQMPEMDGFEATTAIREKEEALGQHTPIVAMTAHAMVGYREKCLDAGMDDYIAKPIQVSELAAKIEGCVPDIEPVESASAEEGSLEADGEETSEISMDRLRNMAQGDDEFMKELCCDFLIDTSNAIKNLETALSEGDAGTARRAVHSIKGLSASVGADGLSNLAAQLEDDAAAENLGPVKESLDELRAKLERVQVALRRAANIQPATNDSSN